MTGCKNRGERIMKFRFGGHDEWWHTDTANSPQAKALPGRLDGVASRRALDHDAVAPRSTPPWINTLAALPNDRG
jgi:hypothetical protein